MDYREFTRRFRDDQEIGRGMTDEELIVYCDNGFEVGAWRVNCRTTKGRGEILHPDLADIARCWFGSNSRSWQTH